MEDRVAIYYEFFSAGGVITMPEWVGMSAEEKAHAIAGRAKARAEEICLLATAMRDIDGFMATLSIVDGGEARRGFIVHASAAARVAEFAAEETG